MFEIILIRTIIAIRLMNNFLFGWLTMDEYYFYQMKRYYSYYKLAHGENCSKLASGWKDFGGTLKRCVNDTLEGQAI